VGSVDVAVASCARKDSSFWSRIINWILLYLPPWKMWSTTAEIINTLPWAPWAASEWWYHHHHQIIIIIVIIIWIAFTSSLFRANHQFSTFDNRYLANQNLKMGFLLGHHYQFGCWWLSLMWICNVNKKVGLEQPLRGGGHMPPADCLIPTYSHGMNLCHVAQWLCSAKCLQKWLRHLLRHLGHLYWLLHWKNTSGINMYMDEVYVNSMHK